MRLWDVWTLTPKVTCKGMVNHRIFSRVQGHEPICSPSAPYFVGLLLQAIATGCSALRGRRTANMLHLGVETSRSAAGRHSIEHPTDIVFRSQRLFFSCLSLSFFQQIRIWEGNKGKEVGRPLVGHTNYITWLSWEPLHSAGANVPRLASGSSVCC